MGGFTLREGLVLAASVLASGIAFLDGTVVNVAIPTIQAHFGADLARILWVVNGYTLLEASLLLVSGSFADRFGRRRVFVTGILVFTLASALCGLAGSVGMLVAARVLQGIGGAMMIPGSLALIRVNTAAERRGRAIGLWSGISGAFGIVGPFVGGWLVETLGWRSIFFVNLPLGLAAALFVMRAVPESRAEAARPTDWAGAALILLALLGLCFGLMAVPRLGWGAPAVWAAVAAGAALLAGFVAVEARSKAPLVPLPVFARPLVAGANLATLLLYFALSSTMLFTVLNLQQLQGLGPATAGLALLPAIVLISLLSGPGGGLADRTGPRLPMVAGALIVAGGIGWLIGAGAAVSYWLGFLPALVLIGLGMAGLIAPLTNSALAVPEDFSGAASGFNNAVAAIAALLAVAVMGAAVVPIFAAGLEARLADAGLPAELRAALLAQAPKFGAIALPEGLDAATAAAARAAIDGAFAASYRVMMTANLVLAVASAAVSAVLIRGRPGTASA